MLIVQVVNNIILHKRGGEMKERARLYYADGETIDTYPFKDARSWKRIKSKLNLQAFEKMGIIAIRNLATNEEITKPER